jgi:hypothetical protein
MRWSITQRLACLMLVTMLSLPAGAGPAGAAQPFFVTAEIDRAKVLSASAHTCSFPIVVHELGTWEISFHSGPGGMFREIRHAQLTTTYTNQYTGTSVSGTQTRGLNIRYDVAPPIFQPDGSVTFTDEFAGAFQNIVVPGVGSISHDAGRLITTHTFGPAPDFVLLATTSSPIAGSFGPLSIKLCALLG